MTKDRKISLKLALGSAFMLLFVLLIVFVKAVDVEPIGPQGSQIGLAGINSLFKGAFGYNAVIDKLTDIALLASLAVAGFFALFGLYQLIKRKSLKEIDYDLYMLAATYAIAAVFYILFEIIEINFRPVILDGELEASFPSSHTLLVVTIMGTAIAEIEKRIADKTKRNILITIASIVIAVTVLGRIACGVHWFTDVLGGIFASLSFVMFFSASYDYVEG